MIVHQYNLCQAKRTRAPSGRSRGLFRGEDVRGENVGKMLVKIGPDPQPAPEDPD
jgi:hypothetical protein